MSTVVEQIQQESPKPEPQQFAGAYAYTPYLAAPETNCTASFAAPLTRRSSDQDCKTA